MPYYSRVLHGASMPPIELQSCMASMLDCPLVGGSDTDPCGNTAWIEPVTVYWDSSEGGNATLPDVGQTLYCDDQDSYAYAVNSYFDDMDGNGCCDCQDAGFTTMINSDVDHFLASGNEDGYFFMQ